jgi:hypothetical protein
VAVLVPVGGHHEHVGAGERVVAGARELRLGPGAGGVLAPRRGHGDRVVGRDVRAGPEQRVDEAERGALAQVVGLRFERQAPHRHARPLDVAAGRA